MTVKERIEALRQQMKENGVDIYVVTTSDFHNSEYVGEHFKDRSFITGFTGSAGTAVITMDEACLWADGRYFIQAAKQIEGSGIILQRMGVEGVPTVAEYLESKAGQGCVIGFDGRCVTIDQAKTYREIAEKVNGSLKTDKNLIDPVWTDRPQLPAEQIWILTDELAGKSVDEKIADIRKAMEDKGAAGYLLTSLYDTAWLMNLRGNDISHVPVFMSYVWVDAKQVILYAQSQSVGAEVKSYLDQHNIILKEYEQVYEDLKSLSKDEIAKVWMNAGNVNHALNESIPSDIERIFDFDPTELAKSVKNATEIENTKKAHIMDGVAMVKFIKWVKETVKTEKITEIDASDYLQHEREQLPDYLDLSFDTIAAYGPNAAMMHYTATEENFAYLNPEGFLLVDSGGHYKTGTTDITRTIVLGPVTDKMRQYYTTVLRSNLRLAEAHFPAGTIGQNLDILSRGPVWDLGLDYRCGTGHGVGHILNVHEGPNAFRWKVNDHAKVWELVPGMITTDEPGLYIEDEFGIRIENELLCVEDVKTEYGQFYKFEQLTFTPIDLDAVDPDMLTQYEKAALNDYHKQVFEKLSPYLNEEEKSWLAHETREV